MEPFEVDRGRIPREIRRAHQGAALGRSAGPQDHHRSVKLVDDRVKEAVAKGATPHAGGVFQGKIYQPTILSNVPLDTAPANEETFGPMIVVEVVDTPEQAVEAANRTLYGLTSSILAGDTDRAFELAPKVLAGIVNINSPTVKDEIHAPMGGVRDGGWGRTGPDSLEFQDVIWINPTAASAPTRSDPSREFTAGTA
jgi:acyl-CoA reductase-like NAD-dependent aldehyde dehydrogenase